MLVEMSGTAARLIGRWFLVRFYYRGVVVILYLSHVMKLFES